MINEEKILPASPHSSYEAHKSAIHTALDRVLSSGRYILGPEVEKFEKEFAAYLGVRGSVGVASGTDALVISLRACNIGPGDEIITVSHTAVATVAAINLCGAQPILIDIDPDTFTMDPGKIEQSISPRTKAILPVHIYGHPAAIDEIVEIANRHGLLVIEDCAQSHGASLKGKKAGAWGHIAAFSFYPTKNLGALGDGGLVTTDDMDLAERVRLLRQYGWREHYISELPGMNTRLDELQAAILRAKLPYLEKDNEKRRSIATMYDEHLADTSVKLPIARMNNIHVYHQYVIRCKYRNSLRNYLISRGVITTIHYPVPIHMQPGYKDRVRCVGPLVETERAAKEILSLPIYPQLRFESVMKVIQTIRDWCKEGRE